ncbi:hypothetical protein P170DRAFT_475889 [Aspergillus steynii IBT 23096]|uniref:Zn(2)-C6 fungal-type domain-containing protein n=1 Tax=Aspergillus steynii IBT 23096 TaxID=1392250 RepID=A0A2I2G9P4_9EURO|nr:uncharacterized protein P170DRAFT_475889 [Aspergillus steynii IBT 23096]PLB49594.1 hypothetical protein P170DRAFT_475889 [Aspergillus steynii IBT 23096]
MAHPFYSPEDEAVFDQSAKRDPLSVSHSFRGDGPQDLIDRSTDCVSPVPDLDGKGRNPARRRIQVACQRCRKRKIKCSGDMGNSRGCSNCVSAGNTNCQFLRVNSSMLQTKVTGWPYAAMNAAISSSQRIGFYAPPITPKMGGPLPVHPSFRAASISRHVPTTYEMGPADSPYPYGRQPFGIDHAINYEDESSEAYSNPQSSAYMIPSTPATVLADYCEIPWNPKAWNSGGASFNRGPNPHVLFSAPESEGSVHPPAYPYLISTPGGTPSTDPSSGAPLLAPLSPEGQGTDRTLPNPTGRYHVGLSSLPTSPEVISGLPLPLDYRVSNAWSSCKGATNGGARTPGPPMSNGGSLGSSPLARTKPFPPNTHDAVLGFLPLTTVGTPSPLLSSSGTFTTSTLDASDSGDEIRGNDTRFTRALSRENSRLLSIGEGSSDTYRYITTEKANKKCSEAGDSGRPGTLLNGLPYTRPKPSDYEVPLPYGALSTEASTEVHRAPVPALSKPGTF